MTDLVCPRCNKRTYDWNDSENDDSKRPVKEMICGECGEINK